MTSASFHCFACDRTSHSQSDAKYMFCPKHGFLLDSLLPDAAFEVSTPLPAANEVLRVWTVTTDNSDFPPGWFVSRCFLIDGGIEPRVTGSFVAMRSLESLRDLMRARNLFKIDRDSMDCPNVVESWL